MKKFLAIGLSAVLAISSLTACGEKKLTKEEKYSVLAESVITAAKQYNELAQLAKDNGWEENFDTIKLMNSIAEQVENLSAVVADPSETEEKKIEELTAEANALRERLETEILPKVQEKYVPAE